MNYVFLGIASILSIFCIILILKYMDSFDDIKEEIIDFKMVRDYFDFCIIGFALISLFNIDYQNSNRNKVVLNCEIMYGNAKSRLMNYFFYGAQVTVAVLSIIITLILFPFFKEMSVLVLGIAALLIYNITYDLRVKVNTRNENIVIQLPEMISKLSLLLNAGLVLRDAWKIVAFSQKSEIYKEMQYIQSEMENGKSDSEALRLFSVRCNNNEVKKFVTLLIQNLQIGGKEITQVLKILVEDMWNQKKAIIRRKAQSASQKLLLPAAIIFIGILLLVIVPLFTSGGL